MGAIANIIKSMRSKDEWDLSEFSEAPQLPAPEPGPAPLATESAHNWLCTAIKKLTAEEAQLTAEIEDRLRRRDAVRTTITAFMQANNVIERDRNPEAPAVMPQA